MPIHVLVVEPKKDLAIERALRGPNCDVRFASEIDQALKLVLTLVPAVIILDMLVPGMDIWKLISRILDVSKKGARSPAFILLTDKVASCHDAHLGRLLLSDRKHLKATFHEAVKGLGKPSSLDWSPKPDLAQDATWNGVVRRVKARGDERFEGEQKRMHRLGILDEKGRATSKERPADMMPGSRTDVAT